MKERVRHLFAELCLVLRGRKLLRTVEFIQYRVPLRGSELQIEARLLGGSPRVGGSVSTV